MTKRVWNGLILLCLLVMLSLQGTTGVKAVGTTIYSIDTFADIADFAPGNSVCSVGSITGGPCSLRAAFQEADEMAKYGDVIINLPPGTYTLSIPLSPLLPDDAMGDLDLTDLDKTYDYRITIRGSGQQPSVINANQIDRVMEIGTYHKVSLDNLEITGGRVQGTTDFESGGGVRIRGRANVYLNRTNVHHNEVICPLSEPDCSFGGGIALENADIMMTNGQMSHNTALIGAAVFNWDGSSTKEYTTTIVNTTINDHSSVGMSVVDSYATLRLINTTLANNNLQKYTVYPVFQVAVRAPTWIQNSTLVFQSGGVNVFLMDNKDGLAKIRNSILISLTDPSGVSAGNCDQSGSSTLVLSEGGNVFSDDSCSPDLAIWDVVMSPAVLTDPSMALLGPLQWNGGAVKTMKPMDGSMAVDRRPGPCQVNLLGGTLVWLTNDARLYPRTDGLCDTGAVEKVVFRGFLPMIRH